MSDVTTRFVNDTVDVTVGVTTTFYAGGINPSGGITQTQADARYIQKTAINAAGGVPGLSTDPQPVVAEDQLPLPPVTLTVLFANRLA